MYSVLNYISLKARNQFRKCTLSTSTIIHCIHLFLVYVIVRYVTLYQSLYKYSVFLFVEFVCWMLQIKLMNFRRFFAAAHVGFGDFVGRVRSIRDADQRETYDENGVPASEINSR